MPTAARIAFDENTRDITRLLALHAKQGGAAPGRRHGLEVLNKSAIVLITAFWEAYCEDIALEALDHLVENLSATDLLAQNGTLKQLKKKVALTLKQDLHDLAVWRLADSGWSNQLKEVAKGIVRDFNTPKTQNIDVLFESILGISNISSSWYKQGLSNSKAKKKLDQFVTMRGAIAHRGGETSRTVIKKDVQAYLEHVKWLAARTGGTVKRHCRKFTRKPLF